MKFDRARIMKRYKNVRSFRPYSRDPRQISERSVVCENPPTRFLFTQMTAGLEECYARMKNDDGKYEHDVLKTETADEEEFLPVAGSILAGRYKVIAKVGEGQSSVLVKAQDTFHPKKRDVAVKILHASYRNLGPQEASCLLHLKKADTLNVANIAHVLNTFTVGNHYCIVFEFLSPTPLYKYFQMFPFSSKVEKINLIRKIAFQVTQCLAVLSSLNIIHSDIKPENILFADGDANAVKIIDFGNAIYWVHDEMSLYFGSFELQTVFYRAPEVMFGLPFGPQIDMWSLGCVLAELYLGEPLFLATSKDGILEKMQTLLGPLPISPFQSGKYFSNFKKFVGRSSSIPGFCKNVVNILKKLGSTDYMFADFIARLLAFDPSSRLSPTEAARHPFLAPECALGFIISPGYLTQESSYSSVCLTPATYPHRPKIGEKIKKLHYSELDLLRVGTQASTTDSLNNVVKVPPFNYNEDLIQEDKCTPTNSEESRNAVGNNVQGRLDNDETAISFGVSSKNEEGSEYPASTDRRGNPYNESCSVVNVTVVTNSVPVEDNKKYRTPLCVVNKDVTESTANASLKDEFCDILDSTNETRSSGAKEEHKDVVLDESDSLTHTRTSTNALVHCVQGNRRNNAFRKLHTKANTTKGGQSSTEFAEQKWVAKACNVSNKLKKSTSSKVRVRKDRKRRMEHGRKVALRHSSKYRQKRCTETEGESSRSTDDISEDHTVYKTKKLDDEMQEMRKSAASRTMGKDDGITPPKATYKRFSSETSNKETGSNVSCTRRTTRLLREKRNSIANKRNSRIANSTEGQSETKDKLKPGMSRSAASRSKKTQQVYVGRVKNDSKIKTRKEVSSRGKEETKHSPSEVNLFIGNSNEVSQNFSMSTAGGSRYADEEIIVDTPQLKSEFPRDLLSAQRSNLQLSENKNSLCVTSDGKQNDLKIESNNNDAKNRDSTKSSTVESFFDAFADDEIDTVTSSTKLGEVRMRYTPSKPSSSKRLSEIRKSSLFQESELVTSSRKNNSLSNLQMPPVSSIEGGHADTSKNAKGTSSSNFREFSDDENGSFALVTFSESKQSPNVQGCLKEATSSFTKEIILVSSSKKQDRILTKKSCSKEKNNVTTKPLSIQSFEDAVNSLSGGSEFLSSSLTQDSKSSVLSMGEAEPQSPEFFAKKRSVFDSPSPCTVVSSTAGVLPGGLSDVKKKTYGAKKDNTFNDLQPASHEKNAFNGQDTEEGQKQYKSFEIGSPERRNENGSVERNSRLLKSRSLPKHELRESNGVYNRNAQCPTDVLIQETVKHERKRKLDFQTVNSPGKPDDLFGLESVAEEQTAKVPKLSIARHVEHGESLDATADKGGSASRNEFDNENKKQNTTSLTNCERVSSFDGIFRRQEQSGVSDQGSDEEYEILLL